MNLEQYIEDKGGLKNMAFDLKITYQCLFYSIKNKKISRKLRKKIIETYDVMNTEEIELLNSFLIGENNENR